MYRSSYKLLYLESRIKVKNFLFSAFFYNAYIILTLTKQFYF